MPLAIRLLCVALSMLLVAHACLAPFVNEGLLFILPLATDALLLWLLWAFSHRRPGTLACLSTYCIMAVVFGLIFSPFSSEYGQWAWVVQSQFVAEAFVNLALFVALRAKSTKSWFHGTSET